MLLHIIPKESKMQKQSISRHELHLCDLTGLYLCEAFDSPRRVPRHVEGDNNF